MLALVHSGLVPPADIAGYTEEQIDEWRMEYDIVSALEHMGHADRSLGVYDDLTPLRTALDEFKPHIVFQMLEEFHGVVTYDNAVVSFLELCRQKYTGCNPPRAC